MSVTALNNTPPKNTATTSNPTITEKPTDAEKTSKDYDNFLLLLTAQLKNQDPLQPLDSTTFVSQLAQFSNVEQQVKMNTKFDTLISNLTGSDFSKASNYLGKYVAADGGKTYIDTNDTKTSFKYKTDDTVKSVNAFITDRFGKEVKNIQLPLAPNGITQNWDLTDNDGENVDNGLYNIVIQTTDAEGKITKTPAETKVKIVQAHKTDTGFAYLTDTKQTLKDTDIKTLYAE